MLELKFLTEIFRYFLTIKFCYSLFVHSVIDYYRNI